MASVVIIGAQWGDEGKGKVVDMLAQRAGMVVRYQGGNNAGHTLVVGGETTVLHLVPSGILCKDITNVVAQGVVVDPGVLLGELDALHAKGALPDPARQLVLCRGAAVILPYHRAIDMAREARLEGKRIGTTGRGIGPAYEDVASRRAVRLGDLTSAQGLGARLDRVLDERNALLSWLGADPVDRNALMDELLAQGERLAVHFGDGGARVRAALDAGNHVVFEGAQGVLLDVLHGTYPYVTSSHTVAGAASTAAGVPMGRIGSIVGVAKAYCTRVGSGPFPSELSDHMGQRLRDAGHEYGSTTGRPRRCGWLDLAALRYVQDLNGLSSLALTKLDVLSNMGRIHVCVGYRVDGHRVDVMPSDPDVLATAEPIYESLPGWEEDLTAAQTVDDLPQAAQDYLRFVSDALGVPIALVGVGPGRAQTLSLRDLWAAA